MRWMLVMYLRPLRIVDISIINGLQQGAAFYASFCIFAIGGCFALLGASDQVWAFVHQLPSTLSANSVNWQFKVLGLAMIYTYAFFKFGWSYRLFMYCAILVGGVEAIENIDGERDLKIARRQAKKSAKINITAAGHFNTAQKAVFFAMGYLGWFAGPWTLAIGGILTFIVLVRRQFFSSSRRIIFEDIERKLPPISQLKSK